MTGPELLDEVAWLIHQGVDVERLPAILGRTAMAISMLARRHHRTDLITVLNTLSQREAVSRRKERAAA